MYYEQYHAESAAKPPSRSNFLKTALNFAQRDIPSLPLKGKEPLTPHGVKDASTDPRRLHMWGNRYPGANIGIPTGGVSGLVVADKDRDSEEVRRIWDSLPPTLEVATGRTSGVGRHRYYRVPKGTKVKSCDLADGLELKGDGCYVVAPPSVHPSGTRYRWVPGHSEMAPLPEHLIEADPKPQSSTRREGATIGLDTGPIPEGSRDNTLARIAGRLHDGTRSLDDLAGELLEINTQRCEPPLPDQQVVKVARSIHGREPCRAGGAPTPEFLEVLEEIEKDLYERDQTGRWTGMGGKSERDAVAAAIRLGRRVGGEIIPGGLRLSTSIREWALESAISKRAMLDYWKNGERKPGVISRLKLKGICRSDNADRKEGESGAIVLVIPTRAEFHHSSTGGCSRVGGETLRAPRLRWSAPRFDRVGDEIVRSTILRLGKGCGAVVDALEVAGGKLTHRDLAGAVGVKRVRDLRRRYLERLERAGVVECSEDIASLTVDYLGALHTERVVAGEVAAEERDREKYARERVGYRNRAASAADAHFVNVGADGYIEDLERVGGLSEADRRTMEAIEAFEGKYGRGSFRWDRASCKMLFYSGPIGGFWPEHDELQRIREYLAPSGRAA